MSAEDYYYQRELQAYREITCKVLNLDKMEVTSQYRSESGRRVVELCTVPNLPLPSALTSYFGIDKIVMTDVIEYPETNAGPPFVQGYSLRTPIYPDKVRVAGQMKIERVSSRSCVNSMEVDVEVNVWGWASMIESIVSGAINNGYTKMPEAAAIWCRRRRWLRLFHRLASGVRPQDAIQCEREESHSEPSTPLTIRSIRSSPANTFCSMDSEDMSERMRDLEGFADEIELPTAASPRAPYEDCQERTVRFNGVSSVRDRAPTKPDSIAIDVGRASYDDSSSDSDDTARKKGGAEPDEMRAMRARLAVLEQQVSMQTGIRLPKLPKLTSNQKMVLGVVCVTMFITWNIARYLHPW